jgi:hypothetical protein
MTTKGGDLNMGDIGNLDRQIEILMECKPLSETEVKQLCEKVNIFLLSNTPLGQRNTYQ